MNDAYKKSIKLLTRKSYSEMKLKEKLLDLGYSQDEVQVALVELHSKKFLNDADYAYFRMKYLIRKRVATSQIIYLLQQEVDLTTTELNYLLSELDQPSDIKISELIKTYARDYTEKEKSRIVARLMRKGFNLSEILAEWKRSEHNHLEHQKSFE